jgi:hypothetical protein
MHQLVGVEDTARGAEFLELGSKQGVQFRTVGLAVRMKQPFLKRMQVLL